MDYLRKVETEPTKVLMLDSNHQVRAGLLMTVLMKYNDKYKTCLPPRAGLAASIDSLHMYYYVYILSAATVYLH